MKLTEREKWLMQMAFEEGKHNVCNEDYDSWIGEHERELCEDVNEEFPPIVKKVDPDNLPDCEVLAFGQGEFLTGYLEAYLTDVTCEYEGMYLENITHYIEQKDLINLIGGE